MRVGLNVVRVGSEAFTEADEIHIRAALTITSGTLTTVGITVDPVEHYAITVAEAAGRDVLDDHAEAEALTAEWAVPNDAIDVFVVRLLAGPAAGLSPIGGPCDKGTPGMDGIVIELVPGLSGAVMAHEVGHFLGLEHVADRANLMYPTVPNGGLLTAAQGAVARDHCAVRPPPGTSDAGQ